MDLQRHQTNIAPYIVNVKGSYTWSQKSALDPQIWVKIVGFESNLTQICGIRALFWLHVYGP